MTLLELMIVVAIIGILVGVAVPLFMKTTKKAKAESEVAAIFAEFKLRQEGYYNENGRYLSTGGFPGPAVDESDAHPDITASSGAPDPISPVPDSWKALRIQTDKTALYCSYVSIAGKGNDPDGNIGTIASSDFSMATPVTDWYYLIARCDVDGNGVVESIRFTNSESDTIAVQNQ